MTYPIQVELSQIYDRLNQIGDAMQDSGWDPAMIKALDSEARALTLRRRPLWDSREAKELGINGGVDHEIFY